MAGELSARIGSNFSDYQGNPILGGSTAQVFNIDTKPLQLLGQYTYYQKRELWKQQQDDTNAKIKELADLSKIAVNDLRDKDKEQIVKEFAVLQNQAAEYARKSPKTAQEKMQNELEWQTRYGAFKNNYNSGKQRAVGYYARQNAILASTDDAKTKDAELRILDKEFADTDIATPISGTLGFKTEKFDVPNYVQQKFSTVMVGDNENLAMEVGVYNPTQNAAIADAAIMGINRVYPKKSTPEYSKLSINEQNQAEIQATVASEAKGWVDAVAPLNQVLKEYVDAEGNFDAARFEDENASNLTLMKPYNALKRYDAYNRDKYAQAKSRVFNDKGLPVKLPDSLKEDEFKAGFINFSKGVNANQLVQSGMFAKYPGDTFIKKLTETDNAIQREELGIRLANLGLEREKLNKANTQDLLAADGILRELTDIIVKGDMPDNQVDVVDSNTGKKKRVFEIGDPNITQKFVNLDKDGKTTNAPDRVRYNPKTNEIDLVYFEKDELENSKPTQTGGHYIREQKTLNARTWANMVTQRTFSGQDKGNVNEIIQSVITKNGGDLYKIAKALGGTSAAPEATSNTYIYNGVEYTKDEIGWTDEQINKALKAGKIKAK